MIDLYCKDGKCPICNGEMNKISSMIKKCDNECYGFIKGDPISSFHIFHYTFHDAYFYDSEKVKRDVIKKIQYYKENDRYLLEILSK